ncbi:MAG TPA: hydroxymethylbilane synthase [Bryobacteraceae bacterium]|jgi:hydroxymethylbilane synthase|nr:hydroxymethylbilane synthase [Bryobacteraceae bacterium]
MIVIGSRGSQLALWQARHIAAKLNVETRIEIIKTTGDKIQDVPLSEVGGKGLFTKEIEEALLDGRIDLAVHSLKDMPSELPAGLILSAIPEREDARDALLGAPLKDGARVGTSSLRRSVQLKALHRNISIETLRGNIDTRIRKLDEGQYDTIVLAAAGLRRLGWADRISELIPVDVMIPAVGQGALAVETRDDSGEAHRIAPMLNHEISRIAVTAERAFLAVFGGGCQVPIGAHATISGSEILLRAFVSEPDGSNARRGALTGTDPQAVGRELARQLTG